MKREQAFTLAELLLALAVTAVLVLMLTSVVSATLTAWQQGRNRLDTFSAARQLIGRMQDEIAAAVAATNRIDFVENSSSLGGNPPVARTSESVFFVSPYVNSGAGDLCVIAYRHDAAQHRLERAFKDSAAAWAPGPASRYRLAGYTGGNALSWRPIAEGVIDFEIRSYSQQNLDNGQEYHDPGNPIVDAWNSAAADPVMAGKTPRRVVLRLRVVDDRTLTTLSSVPAGSAPYNAALQAGAREFFADFTLVSR